MKNWRNIIMQKRTVSDDFIRTNSYRLFSLILGTRPRIDQSVNAVIRKQESGPFPKSVTTDLDTCHDLRQYSRKKRQCLFSTVRSTEPLATMSALRTPQSSRPVYDRGPARGGKERKEETQKRPETQSQTIRKALKT